MNVRRVREMGSSFHGENAEESDVRRPYLESRSRKAPDAEIYLGEYLRKVPLDHLLPELFTHKARGRSVRLVVEVLKAVN
ncbi:hypothetical protein L2E82_35884 [Cichorium intybus]|uniref:Uncharacterized protein n=1 Tax=Cichorium intybus TaxID=13427 RepID=A0ACB9BQ47_CICIN|nr:hypothetical protein L2E82_35884 [Cichorium intybus]